MNLFRLIRAWTTGSSRTIANDDGSTTIEKTIHEVREVEAMTNDYGISPSALQRAEKLSQVYGISLASCIAAEQEIVNIAADQELAAAAAQEQRALYVSLGMNPDAPASTRMSKQYTPEPLASMTVAERNQFAANYGIDVRFLPTDDIDVAAEELGVPVDILRQALEQRNRKDYSNE